jgi:hypothetical protein
LKINQNNKVLLKKLLLASKIACLMILLFLSNSCAKKIRAIIPNTSMNDFNSSLEGASPEFVQGWKDGCETGVASGSNTFYKSFFDQNVVQGHKIAGSTDYRVAWSNAFLYCFRANYVRQKTSIWGSFFGGYR